MSGRQSYEGPADIAAIRSAAGSSPTRTYRPAQFTSEHNVSSSDPQQHKPQAPYDQAHSSGPGARYENAAHGMNDPYPPRQLDGGSGQESRDLANQHAVHRSIDGSPRNGHAFQPPTNQLQEQHTRTRASQQNGASSGAARPPQLPEDQQQASAGQTNGTARRPTVQGEETDDELRHLDDIQAPPPAKAPTKEELQKGPPGGYDPTPIPHRPAGYTVRFTIHRATHLPMADLSTLSADPYCKLELKTGLPQRHKEDPPLTFRTRTIWRETEPEWNQCWVVANVPSSGCRLKARVYDEDSNDIDDRLGNAHVTISNLSESWEGIHNKPYKIEKRAGSWRAYAARGIAVAMKRTEGLNGYLYVSAECLGRTPGEEGGRAYTVGLQYWCKNYSPLLGRLAGSKEPDDPNYHQQHDQDHAEMTGDDTVRQSASRQGPEKTPNKSSDKKGAQRYNFQSNQMQLQGPVPPELYHRYVEFRPFVKSLFTGSGMRGIILNKALHAQHTKVYNFNRDTRYGLFEGPCSDMTMKFLDLAHWDIGGRIHTYVLTLDGLLRFTETGKEFSIDLLSKHTMHSDASIYIAYSGEFFIRRLKNKSSGAARSRDRSRGYSAARKADGHAPSSSMSSGQRREEPPHDPSCYELIIDNDSGTYRPNGKLLPLLRQFLEHNLTGLKINTLDSQNDSELMNKLKGEQRERKKKEGNMMVFTQVSRSSSLSSSDEERLDDLANEQDAAGPRPPKHQLGQALGPFVNEHEHLRKAVAR